MSEHKVRCLLEHAPSHSLKLTGKSPECVAHTVVKFFSVWQKLNVKYHVCTRRVVDTD